jgi:two-component system LytT family response regulator
MPKIRAIIADDEPLARRGIKQLLAAHHDVTVVAEARNGSETITAVLELKPDLLFLDVDMPELDGFAALGKLDKKSLPAIIFVTAYDEFAVRAFDAQALDYLVKPLQESRFAQALDRMRQRLQSAEAVDQSRKLSALLAEREKKHSPLRILVPTSTGDLVIDVDEIDWIEAEDYYAAIHSHRGRYLIRESLASLEDRLDSSHFVRVHRSAIVNIHQVRELRSDTAETLLLLRDGSRVTVSRRRREKVSRMLQNLKS